MIIKDKEIGKSTYIIAEIGSNHNRDIKIAKKLIDKASEANVDAVKFQTFKAEKLYSKKEIELYNLIKSIEIPREWHKELFEYSENKGLHFLSTPFDYDAVDELNNIGVFAFKISSLEILDLEFLEYIAKTMKPIILSTGAATLEEIKESIQTITNQGNKDITLLHCVASYPAPVDSINLNVMNTLSKLFKFPVGLSDHTLGIHISVAAVAMGAKIIEKHITLNRNMEGPDHRFAIEPQELKQMVLHIRDIEKAKGDGIKKLTKEEENFRKLHRSIIALKDISKSTIITRDMLIVKRPAYGIKPKFINKVVGKIAKRNIKADEWITWDMI